LPGTEIAMRDESGQPLPPGEVGEIHLRSAYLFDGYHRQPELTAERLHDGWYRTGDIGFLDRTELFVIGRLDDVLNINGRKIVAHEIEDALNPIPGLAPGRILVHAEHDADQGSTQLVVVAERAAERATDDPAGDKPLAAAIRRAVLDQCGRRPGRVALLGRGVLLKSTSGKITRDTTADDIAGWDSLRHAILLMNVERAFAIRFDPAEVLDLDNVGALADILAARLAQPG
jgi:acyl-CoA synthetase (AMP-forming)/AMP-acid ligase II